MIHDHQQFNAKCLQLGLNPARMRLHADRVQACLQTNSRNFLPLRDTCRTDNGGIIPFAIALKQRTDLDGIVSFTPSAGASSRYLQVFANLLDALASENKVQLEASIEELLNKGAKDWHLPQTLSDLIKFKRIDDEATRSSARLCANWPKAFFPCVKEGHTFFDLKLLENEALGFLRGQSFVVNPKFSKEFRIRCQDLERTQNLYLQTQGPEQSTIRFKKNGDPLLEDSGEFSTVPAGHGTLASLLPELQKRFPEAHSALIRNIDNVIGTKTSTLDTVKAVVNFHNLIFNAVQSIRQMLANSRIDKAESKAVEILDAIELPRNTQLSPLWQLQASLFYTNREIANVLFGKDLSDIDLLNKVYARPVNTLGQVPNTQKDVGGTPCFVALDHIQSTLLDYKICLEIPHASSADQEKYLRNPKLATHFNPVFVLAELNFEPQSYEHAERSSWILAEKQYGGETVYYHESVLYEFLGNTLLANACFLEIPRSLFNPHKSLTDAKGRSIREWINDDTA